MEEGYGGYENGDGGYEHKYSHPRKSSKGSSSKGAPSKGYGNKHGKDGDCCSDCYVGDFSFFLPGAANLVCLDNNADEFCDVGSYFLFDDVLYDSPDNFPDLTADPPVEGEGIPFTAVSGVCHRTKDWVISDDGNVTQGFGSCQFTFTITDEEGVTVQIQAQGELADTVDGVNGGGGTLSITGGTGYLTGASGEIVIDLEVFSPSENYKGDVLDVLACCAYYSANATIFAPCEYCYEDSYHY
jgi:hypothetical protein